MRAWSTAQRVCPSREETMTNRKINFKGSSNRKGPYRVWTPVVEGGRAILVARWIDPNSKDNRHLKERLSCVEEERGGSCPGINLQVA
jgi:hypothetical protein